MTRRDVFSEWAALERALGGRIGSASPSSEPLRFVPPTSLAFPSTDAEPTSADPREWTTHFLSLAGSASDLPPYLAEEIALEEPERPVRRALLTPFHHRATALLFRSVHRCRVADETRSLDDAWPTRVRAAVIGQADVGHVEHRVALAIAPLLHAARSEASLVRALHIVSARWLGGAKVALDTRSGDRAPVALENRARLGRVRLGDDALLGSSVLDPSSRAIIRVGPIDLARARALEADGSAIPALRSVMRWFADPAVDLDLVFVTEDVRLRLGATRLGASALGGGGRTERERHVATGATHDANDRQACSNRDRRRPSKDTPHATRSASARPEAYPDRSPTPRERGDERGALAAW